MLWAASLARGNETLQTHSAGKGGGEGDSRLILPAGELYKLHCTTAPRCRSCDLNVTGQESTDSFFLYYRPPLGEEEKTPEEEAAGTGLRTTRTVEVSAAQRRLQPPPRVTFS